MVRAKMIFTVRGKGQKPPTSPTLGNYRVRTNNEEVEFNFQEGEIIGRQDGEFIIYEVHSRKIQICHEDLFFPELFSKSYQSDFFEKICAAKEVLAIPVFFPEGVIDSRHEILLEEFKILDESTGKCMDMLCIEFDNEYSGLI